jgi:hypothetical protein
MNALSLLNKGHTIKGFNNRSNAYRLTNWRGVPNFSARKNTPPTPSHPEAQAPQSSLFDQPKPPPIAPQPVPRQPFWNRMSGFCRSFLRLLPRWGETPSSRDFTLRCGVIQTELALEKVKVIRNDLSEDDMVVIPAGRKEKPAQHDQCQAISTNR